MKKLQLAVSAASLVALGNQAFAQPSVVSSPSNENVRIDDSASSTIEALFDLFTGGDDEFSDVNLDDLQETYKVANSSSAT